MGSGEWGAGAARPVLQAPEPGSPAGGARGVGGGVGTVAQGGRRAGGGRVIR